MKASASKWRHLLQHSGPAVVFSGAADMARRLDDPKLEVHKHSVLVLQNIGPVGNPAMPEAGMIPIPRKLAEKGVLDMLRISDGRMSGTAGGSIILHVSPEAADPDSVLGIIEDGDIITCDASRCLLQVDISAEEIKRRVERRMTQFESSKSTAGTDEQPAWVARKKARGYRGLFMRSVLQAERGADFDFLTAVGPS
ncbi:Dihydroxy-acid/6-phosphogluconate dehydratase [Fusarium oxysporum f. sp. vasinfectum]|nr:Dihydroxy-acid/6-phosphogluconate dehydratase [Fusarium oxysporum f. sp. vasinfectum]